MKYYLLVCIAGMFGIGSIVAAPVPAHESEFFTQRVQENLRRLSQFAENRTVDWKADDPIAVPVMSAVWNPDSYQAYLKSIAPALKPDSKDILLKTPQLMLDPTAEKMVQLSAMVSEALHKRPANAELHDHAALLVATLILRESSGRFYDTRDLLSRLTAHLAFSRYLQPKSSATGVIAEAILEAELGHAERALALAKSLPEALRDWQHIVTIRVTGDWRTPAVSNSILYRLLHTRSFLAASNGQASQRIVDGLRLQDAHIRDRTDWYRSLLQDPPSRKYLLNKFNESSQMEAVEMTAVVTSFNIAPAKVSDSIALLNTVPGYVINPDPVGLPKVEVLDWGTWAAHFQRHLCHNLNFVLGEQMIERRFYNLTLYPFIVLQQRRKPDGLKRHVIKRAIQVCRDNPQLVNSINRLQLSVLLNQAADGAITPFEPQKSTPYLSAEHQEKPTLGFPPRVRDVNRHQPIIRGWLSALPTGSYYEAEERFSLLSSDQVQKVMDANPYLSFYAQQRVVKANETRLDLLDKTAGPRSQYDLHVMGNILFKLKVNSKDYHQLLERIMQISPSAKLLKANMYYIEGDMEKAVESFNQAVESKLPPNRIAESSLWMIDHLMAQGEGEKALGLAETAAAAGGLMQHQRYIRLLETMGKDAEAEKAVIRMQKHFPATVPLIRFYVQKGRLNGNYLGERNVSTALGEIKYRPRLQEAERKAAFNAAESIIFPGGKETFQPGPGRPLGGMVVRRATPGAPVAVGDVLAAFNSVAVNDVYQYHFLRRETDAPDASLMLWGEGRGYYTVRINLEEWDKTTNLTFAESAANRLSQRLAQAKTTHKLNLSRLGLKQVPQEVFSLKELKVLTLTGNPLKTLSSEIAMLTNLEKLDVSDCALTTLPERLGNLSNLTALRAGENGLKSLPDSLGGLAKLELLYLKENDFEQVPTCITAMKQLKYLVLSNNRLSMLPPQFSQLTTLKAVSLGRNEFSSFPPELLGLTQLEQLVLLDNELSALPEGVGTLQGLKRLDLRRNQLTALPDSVVKLSALLQLQLGKNCLSVVPESLWAMTALVELDLGANGLTQISPKVANLKHLKRLVISSNRLAKFPPTIAEMPGLREVEYGGNYFSPEHVLVIMNMAKNVKFTGNTYDKN